jgi:GNAT superfamily N-acetyltransferase
MTAEDYADADRLIRAYLVELPFKVDFQDVDRELAELPTEYGPPSGAAVLVRDGGHAVGFVGVRRFADHDAELKRMYLEPEARGSGIGRSLAEAGVEAARALGYRRLLLDTVEWMAPAIALYESLGFVAISPYRHNPLAGARYFALDL